MYELLAGKQRALVFPVMCNGYIKIDYSDNVPNLNYGVWDHEGDFTFEAVITPYDINGYSKWSSGDTQKSSTNVKIMPGVDTTGTLTNFQSHLYLNNSDRLNHKMCLFHSTSLKIYITNATSNNQNNPASFKIEVQITIGGVTQTYTSDTVILPDFGPQLDYGGSADNRGTLRNGKFNFDETSTVSGNFSGGGTAINCTPTTGFFASGSQEVFIWTASGFEKIGSIASKLASQITLSTAYSEDISLGTKLYVRSSVEPTYVNGFFHVAVSYGQTENDVTLFLNGRPVSYNKHSSSSKFAFDKEDYFLGANGTGGTGNNAASTNEQFMGEFHEISVTNTKRTEFPSLSNLLPNFNNTLLYLRFEEVDL